MSPDGVELARVGGFQHNAKLRNGGAFDSKAVTQLAVSVVKALESKALPEAATAA